MTNAIVTKEKTYNSVFGEGIAISPKDRSAQDCISLHTVEVAAIHFRSQFAQKYAESNKLGELLSENPLSSSTYQPSKYLNVTQSVSPLNGYYAVGSDHMFDEVPYTEAPSFFSDSKPEYSATDIFGFAVMEYSQVSSLQLAESIQLTRSGAEWITDFPQLAFENAVSLDADGLTNPITLTSTESGTNYVTDSLNNSLAERSSTSVQTIQTDQLPKENDVEISLRDITLTELNYFNLLVSEKHFGGNVLYTRNTIDGTPSDDFLDAVDYLDITYQRYPAGQPDVAYIDGVIVDGYLPDNLVNFLSAAREQGFKVLVVTPTHAAYTNAADIGRFAELIARDFGDVLHAFEIGNEYWNHQTETSYGKVANDSVLAIADALHGLGVDYPIWVQMGDAGGWESEFHTRNDDRGWLTRTIEANNAVIDQISHEAFSEIDGVVEHFYLRGGGQYIYSDEINDQMISLDFAIWQNYLRDDATLNITEWNIRTSNLDQLGIRAASSLISHFTHIVELGADEAYLWPPHLNTSSDLAGSGEVIVDKETGIVINSVGGAVFDLMSSSLPGLEYLPASVTNASSSVLHHLYAGEEKVVVYLSSRSEVIEQVSYSLGSLFEEFSLTSAIRIGYDYSTSDGRHYNYKTRSWDVSKTIQVNGKDYVINEHDVRATVDVLNHTHVEIDGKFSVELLPYQIVELTFTLPSYQEIFGTNQIDEIEGTLKDDLIRLFGGDDSVTAGDGADTIHGGNGADFVNSGSGSDSVHGGNGNDSIRGWGGDDSLFGGDGHDNIQGSFGKDSLDGGSGDDILEGGDWHDTLNGGVGDDTLSGGKGNDILIGGDGINVLNGDAGDDFIFVKSGTDLVIGGSGYDTLSFEKFREGVAVWTAQGVIESAAGHTVFSQVERVIGTSQFDRFVVTSGNAILDGANGNDTFQILGGENVKILGGSGNDFIQLSGARINEVHAGVGNDRIFSQFGQNDIWGGKGTDDIYLHGSAQGRVHFSEDDGEDYVYGFDAAQDELVVDANLLSLLNVKVQGDGTVLDFGGGDKIKLYDVFDFSVTDDLILA